MIYSAWTIRPPPTTEITGLSQISFTEERRRSLNCFPTVLQTRTVDSRIAATVQPSQSSREQRLGPGLHNQLVLRWLAHRLVFVRPYDVTHLYAGSDRDGEKKDKGYYSVEKHLE